jgi:hypothetical protein
MGGLNIFPGETGGMPSDAGAVMASRMRKRGLLGALMGVSEDPGAQPEQPASPSDNRFVDDPVTRNQPAPPSDDLVSQAPQMAQAGRASLAQKMQQPAQPEEDVYAPLKQQIRQMQGEYDKLNQPPPPRSVKSRIFGGVMGALEGTGGQPALDRMQQKQEFEQGQKNTQRGRLLTEIQAGQRTLGSEQTADKRMTLQQGMEDQRERERQASQERSFGQQNTLEATKESARAQQAREAQQFSEGQQDRRFQQQTEQQGRQFGEQEKLATMRQTSGAAGQRSYQFQSKRMDKIAAPIEQRAERISRLEDTLNQNNPQADALVAPELLTVMAGGQGSGLRMNEAEIARIIGGRSAWETLKANIQHWSTDPQAARSITPDQQRQIRSLFGAIKTRVGQKMQALDEERQNLANSDNPAEHRLIYNRLQKRLSDLDVGGGAQTAGRQGGGQQEVTATGPGGHKIAYRGGKWVDAATGNPIQ